jgi:tetratricopeptide (TPR) repeat protein/tRNA A-37 threonylcarbamoyl transferase component Bud32
MSDAFHWADPTETVSDRDRDPFERLAEEFAEECREGKAPSISEYEARYPQYSERIRKLLPTVAMMEQLKRQESSQRPNEPSRAVPERFGEYRVIRELGRGGMGIVYEAIQESLGRRVALKVIHAVHLDARRLNRFQREAQVVARFHHANIVPIFGVGEQAGLPYFVMQQINGSGLDSLLARWRREGPPPDAERWHFVARLGRQAAEGIQYAHDQGVLHRDIKPANILIDEQNTVWITDFGLSKLIGQDDLTASGDVIGTLRYLAPETLRGETEFRSDVYSLGLTLYEMLTLSPPFGDLSASELLRSVSESRPTLPRRLDPSIPRDLETIVLKAIAREPRHRYATARALANDLACFLEDRPIRARRATSVEQIWRWSRRNRATAAMTAAAIGALVLAAIVGWVGYMSTIRALEEESRRRGAAEVATMRSDRIVVLSLEVFQELFDQLASDEALPPPPLGQPRWNRAFAPRDHGGPREGLGPPPGKRRPGPERPEGFAVDEPKREPPPGPPDRELRQGDSRVLPSVLRFYEKFARENSMDPKLQGEAAWAYRKVGMLYQQLERDKDAALAFTRAIEIFETLLEKDPKNREYRTRLVDTYDMADPWGAEASTLEVLVSRLQRARSLIDQLALEQPENLEYALARLHVHAKLGVALQRRGRVEAAEASYREAIEQAGDLIEQSLGGGRPLLDRVVTREALALLFLETGRREECRHQLDAGAADLDRLSETQHGFPPPPDRYEHLASAYEKLGETAKAERMLQKADEARARDPGHGRRRGPAPVGAPHSG